MLSMLSIVLSILNILVCTDYETQLPAMLVILLNKVTDPAVFCRLPNTMHELNR